ncbi:DUF5343 domain-containing protein [Elizabethkingia meningoseptica]|nr:DUF5343 domain-containing protein [Elizabethkingia meningoseptica]MDE5436351.1 DUF5343 domain-containing protein [Elizabethkingia meningoseptica]MDE5508449.1 DUF5343 domain-containing protein [Elizabethkingia meningoseptica]MDE5515157.1 DUF5343 domain-containing protein [Elizabethkingia meningoseptica]MDE5529423.1 DUF5343 domain-containing protein [Elizabethkingia meningoseptica]
MISTGTLPKILNKICEAAIPENFNYDFLGTKLGFKGGNQKAFIPWAKKCGLLNDDGTPTALYKDFRNPQYRGTAMTKALKKGYAELFLRNEYANDLQKPELVKLVTDVIGQAHDSPVVRAIVNTFLNAKEFADFEAQEKSTNENSSPENQIEYKAVEETVSQAIPKRKTSLGINYTINLVLPKTDDPSIYNAIFKSLKENLLDE